MFCRSLFLLPPWSLEIMICLHQMGIDFNIFHYQRDLNTEIVDYYLSMEIYASTSPNMAYDNKFYMVLQYCLYQINLSWDIGMLCHTTLQFICPHLILLEWYFQEIFIQVSIFLFSTGGCPLSRQISIYHALSWRHSIPESRL